MGSLEYNSGYVYFHSMNERAGGAGNGSNNSIGSHMVSSLRNLKHGR